MTLLVQAIPIKLFIDGHWKEICFPIRPHDGKIMADSMVVEIRFVDECELVFQWIHIIRSL